MKRTLIVILSILILTGCGCHQYKTDIDAENKDYWKYALGDYKVESTKYKKSDSGGLSCSEYYIYTYSYKDKNGKDQSFYVSNLTPIYESIYKDVLDPYFDKVVFNNFVSNNYYHLRSKQYTEEKNYDIGVTIKKINKDISYLDPVKGVDIKNLDDKNYFDNNLNVLLMISLATNNINLVYEDYKTKLIEDFSYLFDIYDSKYLTLLITIENDRKRVCQTLDYKDEKYIWDDCYKSNNELKWYDK